MTDPLYLSLGEWLDTDHWPVAGLLPESLDGIWFSVPEVSTWTLIPDIQPPDAPEVPETVSSSLLLEHDLELRLPGIDIVMLSIAAGTDGEGELDLKATFGRSPSMGLAANVTLRVDAEVLRPLKHIAEKDIWEPDKKAKTLDIPLGEVTLSLNADGEVDLDIIGNVSVPRCMVGSSGVELSVGALRWLTPSSQNLPATTPDGFTGLYLDNVDVTIPQLPKGTNDLLMDYAFLGTGGFSGKLALDELKLEWDAESEEFAGSLHGKLFGFQGGLTKVELEFEQTALVGCDIAGDVFVPYFDKRVGLTLGLDGSGGLTATATTPFSKNKVEEVTEPSDTTVPAVDITAAKPGTGDHLIRLEVGDVLAVEVDTIRFDAPAGGPAALELTGELVLDLKDFPCPPLGIKGLRVDADGKVAIAGGWIDLDDARAAPFHGFPLQITRFGFGSEEGRRWFGLNGGLKLADGLPLGASVEGLRISWSESARTMDQIRESLDVSLKGIGLEVAVPGAFEFKGAVAFFNENDASEFRGKVKLGLPTIGVKVDADLRVGQTAEGVTYFYFYLSADIPTGIPLFQTGLGIYGFQGLVANNMTPDRRDDESMYYGWYLRAPRGATDSMKWRVSPGGFAVGLGTTIATLPDTGFSLSTKVMLILILPGPQVLLEGKGSFLAPRPGSADNTQEGTFEALLDLNVPAKYFAINLGASYAAKAGSAELVSLRGGAEALFSWAPPLNPPADIWHLYLGEWEIPERRWQAKILSLFEAHAALQLSEKGVRLGAWVGMDQNWTFGPVRAWLTAVMEGHSSVSWRPPQFTGTLDLTGDAGLSAFGAQIYVALAVSVDARGPAPWYVAMEIHLEIKIDLWLFKYDFGVDLPLSWGDPNLPLPQPVTPIVERVAFEHLKVDEGGDLKDRVIPPDGRPVVSFSRPVRDLARLGQATMHGLPAESVGPRSFSYQLGHLALLRREGATSFTVVTAAGHLVVENGSISLPGGLSLPQAAGGRLQMLDGPEVVVTGSGAGTLSVSDPVPTGTHSYRLNGPQLRISAQISKVIAEAVATGEGATVIGRTAEVLLSAPTGGPTNAFGGGDLTTTDGTWKVIGNDGVSVLIRIDGTLPTPGPATLVSLSGPNLDGIWLPLPRKAPEAGKAIGTQLMLWTKTPYAWLRRSDDATLQGFDLHGDEYACGPTPVEEPVCITFGDIPSGPLQGSFTTEHLSGGATGTAEVRTTSDPDRRILRLGFEPIGTSQASIRIGFEAPVERVTIYATAVEAGMVLGIRDRHTSARQPIGALGIIELNAEIDEVVVEGYGVTLTGICFSPGWRCIPFEPSSFPQNSTGTRTYAGLTLRTQGSMSVTSSGVLHVSAPKEAPLDAAVLEIDLPQPVTRLRIGAASDFAVEAFAGEVVEGSGSGSAVGELVLVSVDRWFDRVRISGEPNLMLNRFCYDVSSLGWQRAEQWRWGRSTQRMIESFAQVDPVLPPGDYRLQVIAGVDDENDTGGVEWETTTTDFVVGPPPGLAGCDLGTVVDNEKLIYPVGGPLNDLGTYIATTMPSPGARPVYRAYDVGVAFNEPYVTRMFLSAGTMPTVAVVDAKGVDRRSEDRNALEPAVGVELSREEETWIKTLHGDGTDRCATIAMEDIVRNEGVLAGTGELLAPQQLHAGELRAGNQTLYRFEFTTSRFATVTQQLATFDGACRPVQSGGALPADLTALIGQLKSSRQHLVSVVKAADAAAAAINQGTPSADAFMVHHQAQDTLEAARSALTSVQESVFTAVWTAYGLASTRSLPTGIEVSQLAGSFLLESPEPLLWERTTWKIERSQSLPLRQTVVIFDREGFGAPDIGNFRYRGLNWHTTAELGVIDGAAGARLPDPWDLTLTLPGAIKAEVVVRLQPDGRAKLTGSGVGASTTQPAGPATAEQTVTLSVSASPLSSITLSGEGMAVVSVSVTRSFHPSPAWGDLRIMDARLPNDATDDRHAVDLIAFADVNLAGWSVRWYDALEPVKTGHYHTFSAGKATEEWVIRLLGGQASGVADPGVVTMFGGAASPPPVGGAVFQLLSPDGLLAHEFALLSQDSYNDVTDALSIIPNGDGTRAFMVPSSGTLQPGHWKTTLSVDGQAKAGLARLSIAGQSIQEVKALVFTSS